MRLDFFLKKYKCDMEPDEFRERLADLFAEMFPGVSDERVACSWRWNRDFAQMACRATKIPINPDTEFQMVWEIIKARKAGRGKLKLYERRLA